MPDTSAPQSIVPIFILFFTAVGVVVAAAGLIYWALHNLGRGLREEMRDGEQRLGEEMRDGEQRLREEALTREQRLREDMRPGNNGCKRRYSRLGKRCERRCAAGSPDLRTS